MPSSPGSHARSSPVTLDGSNYLDPNSMQTPIRNRRTTAARPSPEIDVWFQPPSHAASPQPHISFPVSNSNSPFHSAQASPYYSTKSSPALSAVDDSPRLQQTRTGLGLSWREGGNDAGKRRKGAKQVVSRQQVVLGAGALVAVTMLYFLLRDGSRTPEVRKMSRGEHDRTGPRSSSMPTMFKVRRGDFAPRARIPS